MSTTREQLAHEIERLAERLEPSATRQELARVRRGLGQARGPGIALADVRIGFQCNQRWDDMVGDDRVRACRGCDRPVFNLSEMTRAEAEAVLATRGLTPCVRFYRRADGTVMTSDCPSGAPRRRLAVLASSIAATATLAAAPAFADPARDGAALTTADSGAISGKLVDAATQEPAIGATVVVTSPRLAGEQVAITDEQGVFSISGLPAGAYAITIYYDDVTGERSGVIVAAGRITQLTQSLALSKARDPIDVELNQGAPAIDSTYIEMGGPVAEAGVIVVTENRPAVEWSLWGRLGAGLRSGSSDVAARRVIPPTTDAGSTWEAALGVDATFGIAHHDNLRLGAWGEMRTTTDPVGGAELVLEGLSPHPYSSRIGGAGSLVLRAGGNTRVITAALGFGYVGSFANSGPWVSWARHVIGARVMLSVNRGAEDPREWSATVGLEVEPIGALHAMYNLVTR